MADHHPSSHADDARIVRCAIHPAIGVARVGNAPIADGGVGESYYYAPEVPGAVADPGPSGFKTPDGAIKREAARFRVYGYDADGNVVRELTHDDDVQIAWRVHVANRKAAWYQFHNAMDMKQYALVTTPRNASYTGARRRDLVIDPGPRAIGGASVSGPQFRLDTGYVRFGDSPTPVDLGEVRTDERGRLVVIGGHGHSASASGAAATTFANNDGWHDDVSDGPVRATVTLGDRTLEAEPAFVAITPPNYGQGLYGPVTMDDVVRDLFIRLGWVTEPETLEFWRDIYPILARLAGNQWVNQGVHFLFGPGSPSDLDDPEVLAALSAPDARHKPARQRVFEWFRRPITPWDEVEGEYAELPPAQPAGMPPFYGDGFGEYVGSTAGGIVIPPANIVDLAPTQTLWRRLQLWAEGDFETGERRETPRALDDAPIAERPSLLDRTPLENCLGGPFHPGIELTWVLRVPRMWQGPYRLNVLPEGVSPTDDYGPELTPERCVGPGGPLAASGPGSLTRWMGVPWQTDEASCLSGYDFSTYLPLPSFWAARVPNEVYSWGAYARTSDEGLKSRQRLKHFDHRQFWLRDLDGSYQTRINNMVAEWDKVGIITAQPAPADHDALGLPPRLWVETGRDPSFTASDPSWRQVLYAEHAPFEPQTPSKTDAARAEDAALKIAADVDAAADHRDTARPTPHPRRRQLRRDKR
ncbi:MAG: LodA/GoxA family CTQ-dependent oxidase [Acidobacteriota bacterium]